MGRLRVRVLLVDDQELFCAALRELLSLRGHEVVGTVRDGAAALEATARASPDVVLVDIKVGRESGLDIARALTSAKRGPAVVLMSMGHISDADLHASGARSFITKERLTRVDLATLTG